MYYKYYRKPKKGAILVLTAIFMLLMFGLLAFVVDVGYLSMARTELQRTADSAAIAATCSLLDGEIAAGQTNSSQAKTDAADAADRYSRLNKVLNSAPVLAESEIKVGYLSNPFNPNIQLDQSGANGYNAVQVRVQRTADQNGVIPLLFARVLGIDRKSSQATATAAFASSVSGFKTPSDGSNLGILPFALDQGTWDTLISDQGHEADNWKYDPETREVTHEPDGIKEINLYPQGTGSPGNRGTVDIGNENNSTKDIARQILHGINAEDLSYLGGKLELNEVDASTVDADGNQIPHHHLPADTGISAGVKDELASIRGNPRVIPLFSSVSGNGNNAKYSITRFVGVRIMEVQLTGNNKRVMIQPAVVFIKKGAIPGDSNQNINYVFTPVCLVR
jgi:Flp pilus assembly protein TadG